MKILCIGDIVGKPGRAAVEGLVKGLRKQHNVDFVIANAENAAGGAGLTSRIAKSLLRNGCDVLTLGDHVWDQKEIEGYLAETDKVIRPANFPEGVPGKGWCIQTSESGKKVAVINLLGRVFMRYHLDSPFEVVEKLIAVIKKETPIIVVDIHAEATSEKVALGHFLDGKVSAVFGTHTHIQTADEKILPQKTAYITDLGMSGPYDSVIGQNKEAIIKRFLTSMPIRFNVAKEGIELRGIIVDVDETTGRAKSIKRVVEPFVLDDKSEDES